MPQYLDTQGPTQVMRCSHMSLVSILGYLNSVMHLLLRLAYTEHLGSGIIFWLASVPFQLQKYVFQFSPGGLIKLFFCKEVQRQTQEISCPLQFGHQAIFLEYHLHARDIPSVN